MEIARAFDRREKGICLDTSAAISLGSNLIGWNPSARSA
jgi:hypothetical protein